MVMMLLSTDLGRYKDKRDVISTYVGMSYVTSHVDYVPKYLNSRDSVISCWYLSGHFFTPYLEKYIYADIHESMYTWTVGT